MAGYEPGEGEREHSGFDTRALVDSVLRRPLRASLTSGTKLACSPLSDGIGSEREVVPNDSRSLHC